MARVAATKKRAEIIVDTVFGSIVETLHLGEKVELRRFGFGGFRLRRRRPHRGRNPRTGDRVDVPSKRIAYFTSGKERLTRRLCPLWAGEGRPYPFGHRPLAGLDRVGLGD